MCGSLTQILPTRRKKQLCHRNGKPSGFFSYCIIFVFSFLIFFIGLTARSTSWPSSSSSSFSVSWPSSRPSASLVGEHGKLNQTCFEHHTYWLLVYLFIYLFSYFMFFGVFFIGLGHEGFSLMIKAAGKCAFHHTWLFLICSIKKIMKLTYKEVKHFKLF